MSLAPASNPARLSPFHVAVAVDDLARARCFNGESLGCPEGRSADDRVDFDCCSRRIVVPPAPAETGLSPRNAVDGHAVPVPHFGIGLPMAEREALAARLRAAGTAFVIEPDVRFKGEAGEQATMFFLDPSGNATEIETFTDITRLFEKNV